MWGGRNKKYRVKGWWLVVELSFITSVNSDDDDSNEHNEEASAFAILLGLGKQRHHNNVLVGIPYVVENI